MVRRILRRAPILAAAVLVALLAVACGREPALDIRGADTAPASDPTAADADDGRDALAAEPESRTARTGRSGPDGRTSGEDRAVRTPPTADRGDRTATPDPGAGTEETTATLERGDTGAAVLEAQRRLVELGYWLGEPDGDFGHLTRQAVLAFQGWEGLSRDGVIGARTRQALQQATRPEPTRGGDLIEIRRDRGVLLVVRDGRTRLALHTSTGSGERYTQPDGDVAVADTPAGTWEVSWQVDGWRTSDLGRLWRPKYFHEDGLAIHGYPEVPAFPASHGCARVSMAAMDLIWRRGLAPVGTTVVVR